MGACSLWLQRAGYLDRKWQCKDSQVAVTFQDPVSGFKVTMFLTKPFILLPKEGPQIIPENPDTEPD